MLRPSLLSLVTAALFCSSAQGQVLIDWDFSTLQTPSQTGPIGTPLLDAVHAGNAPSVNSSPLTGERAVQTFSGLEWSTAGAAPGELNLRYFDGDPSDSAGTNSDGVSDNYVAFTMTSTGAPIQVGRISVSAWRNGNGAPGQYVVEVVADGGTPVQYGPAQIDPDFADSGYDWFHFDDQVQAASALEVRFRPVAAPGGQGTGNLHINGLRVAVTGEEGPQLPDGPNVVFLIADDLTASALACYGNPNVSTPNIDALAAQGMVFDRAYCQFPVCASSRSSMLTGLYPNRIQALGGSSEFFDGVIGAHSTLPEHFKLNGWTSARVSKLYHMRIPGDITNGVAGPDHVPSWDITYNAQAPEWMTTGIAGHYTNESLNFNPTAHYGLGFGAAFYAVESNTSGAEQADALAATAAENLLDGFVDERFFLAVGFVRPHVPLVAPAAHFGLYDPATLPLAESVAGDLNDIPSAGVFWNEPSRGPNNDADRRAVLQAYYASVSFMDEQVGRVLARLDTLGLRDDTIVVFTSDHGYHLGEHTMWQKLSLHEESAKVPLIIAGPGIPSGRTGGLAELLDLYPTLTDLAGLDTPPACQGLSLRPLLEGTQPAVREAAYSRVSGGDLLRTEDWAYMRYSNGTEELYDMRPLPLGDPKQFTNLAGDSTYTATLLELRSQLDSKILAAVASPGQAFCFGDGSGAACPCLAYGGPGEGCMSSSGSGATLTGGGSADLTSDSFNLTMTGGPPNKAAILFHGLTPIANPLESGILCAAPAVRYGVRFLDADGSVRYAGLGGQALPGTTYYYQCFYRDITGPCTGVFNSSNGWQVTWR